MLWLLAIETVALAGFVVAQTRGLLGWGGRLVAQLGLEHGHGEALGRIDEVLARFFRTAPWRLVLSLAFHLVAWLLGSLEAWLLLPFLGVPVSITAAVVSATGTPRNCKLSQAASALTSHETHMNASKRRRRQAAD